jgi:hypothetical protein
LLKHSFARSGHSREISKPSALEPCDHPWVQAPVAFYAHCSIAVCPKLLTGKRFRRTAPRQRGWCPSACRPGGKLIAVAKARTTEAGRDALQKGFS